jgi:GTP-binding protein
MMKIAIIGRANVGKTSLFNKMAGKKLAIVYDTPGVTRDRNEKNINFFDIKCQVIDTAGIELINLKKSKCESPIEEKMTSQALHALNQCDLCLFVVDSKDGITSQDKQIASIVRNSHKDAILLCNKSEGNVSIDINEVYSLGFENKVFLSAEHKIGFDDLYSAILPYYTNYQQKYSNLDYEESCLSNEINIAIVGRPNAGKSTLINKIINEERLITDKVAGTTRDSVSINIQHANKNIKIIDTAGIRRRMLIDGALEENSVEESFKSINFCHIAILVMDIENALESQDVALARKILQEGRALIMVFNKWDKVDANKQSVLLENLRKKIKIVVPDIKEIIYFTMSALEEKNFTLLLDESINLYDKWSSKISTNKLNQAIFELKEQMPIIKAGRRLKLKFITQVTTRPPTFTIFANFAQEDIDNNHISFIRNFIANKFNFLSILIRINIRHRKS